MLNFDRSTAKHGTQNIQNDRHQGLSDSFKVHQIRFRPGLRPGPQWLAGLRGPTTKGKRKEKRGKGEKRGRGRKWEGPPLSQIPV